MKSGKQHKNKVRSWSASASMGLSGKRGSSVKPITVPHKIKIRHEKNYHTHYVGKSGDGTQFMAFIVGVPNKKMRGRTGSLNWYAILHLFDVKGRHKKTQSSFLGTKPFANELKNANATLTKMIRALGPVSYTDVEVELFSVLIDGHIFGLVDASVPEEGYSRIDLLPNNLAFFPPWDGTYST